MLKAWYAAWFSIVISSGADKSSGEAAGKMVSREVLPRPLSLRVASGGQVFEGPDRRVRGLRREVARRVKSGVDAWGPRV